MSFGVQGEMVGSGKALAANLAEERTRSGVFSRVPRQLVRAGKGVATVGPRAGVGSFSCVDPFMNFQDTFLLEFLITILTRKQFLIRNYI